VRVSQVSFIKATPQELNTTKDMDPLSMAFSVKNPTRRPVKLIRPSLRAMVMGSVVIGLIFMSYHIAVPSFTVALG
jgi:hypothetical protein